METLGEFSPLFQAVIAFTAFFSLLSFVFHWFLSPLKENQIRLESELKEVKMEVRTEVRRLESKVDQLLTMKN